MRCSRFPVVTLVIAVAALIGFFAPQGSADEPQKAEPDRLAQLERRVEELSRDNARLKQERDAAVARQQSADRKVKVLEQRLERQRVQLMPPNVAPLTPPSEQVPPNWSPRQFNGMTYYVIPLEQRQGTIAK